jgi:hypothetical protein
MESWFDNHQIATGFIIGIIASGIVALVTVIIQNWIRKEKLKKKYGRAAGNFECYGFERINPNLVTADPSNYKRTLESTTNGSVAEIKYKEENILSIKLTQKDGNVWVGDILMELETLGSVAWRYTTFPKEEHWFGLKRIIIRDNGDCIYLVGEVDEGFGKEVLIRTK